MKLSDRIAGRRTKEEYKMIEEEAYENTCLLLESSAVPIPVAVIKIVNMVAQFDYSKEQAECIIKYIGNYKKLTRLVDSQLKSLLTDIQDALSEMMECPEREIYIGISIDELGVFGGVYNGDTEIYRRQ